MALSDTAPDEASSATPTDKAPAPLPDLTALFEAGEVAARYPLVAGLVAPLSGMQLARAGQLLSRIDPGKVLSEHPTTPVVSVAITAHGTVAPLLPTLTAEMARHGLLLRPFTTDFDSYIFQLSDPGSALYGSAADLTLCVLDAHAVFDEVPVTWSPADVAEAFAAKLALTERLVRTFETSGRGTLVLNTLPLPRTFAAQLVDYRSRAVLGAVWREANASLLRLAEQHPAVVVVDLDLLVAEGIAVEEPRLDVYAKAHLSADLLARYAREIGHLARHVAGRTKKALVLDLDGTVWGGVLGEDGVDGIEVAESYRGEAFRAFQRVAKQLGSQGVLLAVVSKNHQDLVRRALRERQDMTLAEGDFVRVTANWRPKHDNLRELAETLNIGVDSLVFVDDSPQECGLVRAMLPDVAVIHVGGEPALHREALLRDGWFDTRELTAEDRTRVGKYRVEVERKDFLDSFESIHDYLRELKVTVRLADAEERDIPRVSQMTLRTNQFNLTTRRLQQPDVRGLLADPATRVLAIHAADRFGDNGTVGTIFLRREDAVVHIDNFLLSCRVFSRGIEQGALAAVLDHARATGAHEVRGVYRATAKNGVVKDFYPRHGFVPAGDGEAGDGVLTFRHDLRTTLERPAHLALEDALGGEEETR
jgi:FkbH-like protein